MNSVCIRVRMGVVKDPPNSICCQNCKRSIAMLFPSSECDCIGGKEKYDSIITVQSCSMVYRKWLKTGSLWWVLQKNKI